MSKRFKIISFIFVFAFIIGGLFFIQVMPVLAGSCRWGGSWVEDGSTGLHWYSALFRESGGTTPTHRVRWNVLWCPEPRGGEGNMGQSNPCSHDSPDFDPANSQLPGYPKYLGTPTPETETCVEGNVGGCEFDSFVTGHTGIFINEFPSVARDQSTGGTWDADFPDDWCGRIQIDASWEDDRTSCPDGSNWEGGTIAGHVWSSGVDCVDEPSPPPPPPPETPTCNIWANPSSGTAPLSGSLTWTTTNNPVACYASGWWNGEKNTSGGSASYGPLNTSGSYTYWLRCVNSEDNGEACSTTVSVSEPPPPPPPPPSEKPDLIISDIFYWVNTVYGGITLHADETNQTDDPDDAACSHNYVEFWVDGVYQGKKWTGDFHPYNDIPWWASTVRLTLLGSYSCSGLSDTIRVCADADNQVDESNENNNCYTEILDCPETDEPDLIITDIWNNGSTIFYKIKNQGNALAGESDSHLFVNTNYKAFDDVDGLSVGSSSSENFVSYTWDYFADGGEITVCADATDLVDESNEDNNCLTETWDRPATLCPSAPSSYPTDKWDRVWCEWDKYAGVIGDFAEKLEDLPDETDIQFGEDGDWDNIWNLGVLVGGIQQDNIGFRSGRTINFPVAGTYTFTLGSDDGAELWIDGISQIKRWDYQGYSTTSADVELTAGNHTFRIDYFEDVWDARVSFTYEDLNQPPLVDNLDFTHPDYCVVGPSIIFYWDFNDDPGNFQTAYQVQVRNEFDVLVYDSCNNPHVDTCSSGHGSHSHSIQSSWDVLDYAHSYSWQVRVWDSGAPPAVSDWVSGPLFSCPGHIYPEPDFTYTPQIIAVGEEMMFIDESICYNSFNNPYSCKNNMNNHYEWYYEWDFEKDKDDNIIGCDSNINPDCRGNIIHTYEIMQDYTVRLYVTDDMGVCDFTDSFTASLFLPSWKEIRPF